MSTFPSSSSPSPSIVVVGAGCGGLAVAVQLLQAGHTAVTIVARDTTPRTTSDEAGERGAEHDSSSSGSSSHGNGAGSVAVTDRLAAARVSAARRSVATVRRGVGCQPHHVHEMGKGGERTRQEAHTTTRGTLQGHGEAWAFDHLSSLARVRCVWPAHVPTLCCACADV